MAYNIAIELARIKYFNEYIYTTSKEIHNIYKTWYLNNKENVKYKFDYPMEKLGTYAEKNLRRIILFIVGLTECDKYVLFPNQKSLEDNKIMILNELFYISSGNNVPYDSINKTIIQNTNKYRKHIDNLYNSIDKNMKCEIFREKNGEYCDLKYKFYNYERSIRLKYSDYKLLKNKYIENDKNARIFIIQLMIRYNCFGKEKNMCLSANILYDFIKNRNLEKITLEEFAGSLNSNLSNYCSLFMI